MNQADCFALLEQTRLLEGSPSPVVWRDANVRIEIEPERLSFRHPIITFVSDDGSRFAAGIVREMFEGPKVTRVNPTGIATTDISGQVGQFLEFYFRHQSELRFDDPAFRNRFHQVEHSVLARLGLLSPSKM